mmetsp:Transcript_6419/g.13298  ORF Transcript_6419/g.13298 Transcript_6419/m.13298 type:complete len:423 (-) Transcript_6419:322-1590(-)
MRGPRAHQQAVARHCRRRARRQVRPRRRRRRSGDHVRLRVGRDGELHAADAHDGDQAGQDAHRRAEGRLALVAAPGWQDASHHQVHPAHRRLRRATADPHRRHLHAARRAAQGEAHRRAGRLRHAWEVHGPRDVRALDGGDERAHPRQGDPRHPRVDQAQERQVCPLYLRQNHVQPAHQPLGQVHHRRAAGRRRPHRTEDHHRHVRRLGRPRRRRLLGQRPDQGGPLRRVRVPVDGQVDRQGRPLQARARAALVRHRRRQAALPLRGDVRHRDGRAHRAVDHGHREAQLRLPPRRSRARPQPAPAQVQRHRRLLPLRPRPVHRGRQDLLRMGERHRPEQIRLHVGGRHRERAGQQEGRGARQVGRLDPAFPPPLGRRRRALKCVCVNEAIRLPRARRKCFQLPAAIWERSTYRLARLLLSLL